MNIVTFARNACFDLARQLGFRYFLQLDDDYNCFDYRTNDRLEYTDDRIDDIEPVFDLLLDFYKEVPATSIAIAQGGDFPGGKAGKWAQTTKPMRKVMNSFFCDVERPFQFVGRINEDTTTYVTLGRKGHVFFTIPMLSLNQRTTQQNAGGLTDSYLENGTYVKSFYSVMYEPSCVAVNEMGEQHRRLHHRVSWDNTTPAILAERYRKPRG